MVRWRREGSTDDGDGNELAPPEGRGRAYITGASETELDLRLLSSPLDIPISKVLPAESKGINGLNDRCVKNELYNSPQSPLNVTSIKSALCT